MDTTSDMKSTWAGREDPSDQHRESQVPIELICASCGEELCNDQESLCFKCRMEQPTDFEWGETE